MRLLYFLMVVALTGCASAKEKATHKMALKDNLVAHWAFQHEPAQFGVWDGAWPNSNTLTSNYLSSDPSPVVDGKIDNAVESDGNQAFSLSPSSAGVSHQGNPFTVAFWFKPTALAQGANVAVTAEWNVTTPFDSGSFYFQIEVDGKQVPVTSVPLEVGEWYFVVFGYRQIGAVTEVWATVNLSDRVRGTHVLSGSIVGSFIISGGGAPGVQDDFAIWRRTLSAQEIRELYNHGDGLALSEWDVVPECEAIPCCD